MSEKSEDQFEGIASGAIIERVSLPTHYFLQFVQQNPIGKYLASLKSIVKSLNVCSCVYTMYVRLIAFCMSVSKH